MTTFPDPALDTTPTSGQQTAVFAGGCFWCTEAVFELVEGVEDVMSGYAGDTEELARYDIVCSGTTRHAEAILITYDAAKVTFGGLLNFDHRELERFLQTWLYHRVRLIRLAW